MCSGIMGSIRGSFQDTNCEALNGRALYEAAEQRDLCCGTKG